MKTHSFSKLIAGTMTWGKWGKNYSIAEMAKLINGCVDSGITSFDHADIYGHYTTEKEFGSAFRQSGISRSRVQFISKCGIQFQDEKRNSGLKHYDYSAAHIIHSVEQSLQNLQTEYLDLLLLHRPSPLMEAEEIAGAVEKLKQAGKILDFGVSNFTPSQTDWIKSKIAINYNQIEFSLTHFGAMLDGSLDHMQLHGIRPMAWAPLGTIFKTNNETTQRIMAQANELAKKYEVSPEAIIIAWVMRHPAGIIPVIGSTDISRMARLQKAATFNLELQDWFLLWTASTGKEVP